MAKEALVVVAAAAALLLALLVVAVVVPQLLLVVVPLWAVVGMRCGLPRCGASTKQVSLQRMSRKCSVIWRRGSVGAPNCSSGRERVS